MDTDDNMDHSQDPLEAIERGANPKDDQVDPQAERSSRCPCRRKGTSACQKRRRFVVFTFLSLLAIICFTHLPSRIISKLSRLPDKLNRLYLGIGGDWEESTPGCVTSDPWSFNVTQGSGASTSWFGSATYDLPSSADNLFVLARGPKMSGNVDIVTSESDSDDFRVEVRALHDRQALTNVKICTLEPYESRIGVGIFTPPHWRFWGGPRNPLRFEITVHIPRVKSPPRLQATCKHLSLYSRMLSHTFGDLSESVKLGGIYVISNQAISAVSLFARTLSVVTFKAPIEGYYQAEQYLNLQAHESNVKASATLYNVGGMRPPFFSLKARNGGIDANVSLIDMVSSPTPSFSGVVEVSNGPLNLAFPNQPLNSELSFRVDGMHAPVNITLHPAYQGKFNLATSHAQPQVEDRGVQDPAGKGRYRSILQDSDGVGRVTGLVYWDAERNVDGSVVEVKTCHAPVRLSL
ncbi:hypothetical protein JAAARDRAFT_159605 [Jaapia argillacea MUCL 33604]|uniref:Uncharacterized protein n=1 Tax=Jaapia argillacea MUCL 33604 TaxID=933084 RepID=A0A067PUT3_9AGAM|nr:hypothetical protein JAAARDRAFT_159605 [Jaapia argillacea MUCL 33604]